MISQRWKLWKQNFWGFANNGFHLQRWMGAAIYSVYQPTTKKNKREKRPLHLSPSCAVRVCSRIRGSDGQSIWQETCNFFFNLAGATLRPVYIFWPIVLGKFGPWRSPSSMPILCISQTLLTMTIEKWCPLRGSTNAPWQQENWCFKIESQNCVQLTNDKKGENISFHCEDGGLSDVTASHGFLLMQLADSVYIKVPSLGFHDG